MRDPMRSGRKNPCFNCPDHKQPCSDTCRKPEYLAWKAEQAKIKKNQQAYREMNGYVHRQSEKNRRERK